MPSHMYLQGFVCITSMVVLPPLGLLAQPRAGTSQPDRLDFGAVHIGSIVEGSVRFFASSQDLSGLAVIVLPPDFVRVKSTELATQEFGQGGEQCVFDVTVSLDTRRTGEFESSLFVKIGSEKVSIPIRLTVLPAADAASKLLVVQTPFEKFSTDDASLFHTWLELIALEQIDANYVHAERGRAVTRDLDLARFDVILLGEVGLIYLQDEEIEKLHMFVESGGHVIVAANRFYRGTVEKANELLAMAGLEILDTESQENKSSQVGANEIVDDPLTEGIHSLRFYRSSPISVTDNSKAKLLVQAPPFPGQGYAAIGKHGKGTFTALGESLWWNWIAAEKYDPSDNKLFLRNVVARRAQRE